jgi:hypothetical protein
MRAFVVALLTLGVGCGEAAGTISAEGSWADGQPIHFSGEAHPSVEPGGRVSFLALNASAPRFAGVRLTYDPARLTAPGRYPLDPTPTGWLRLFCIRTKEPDPGSVKTQLIEYEAGSGSVTFERIPGAGGSTVAGTFEQVMVQRAEGLVLTLTQGRFRGRPPAP